MKIIITGCGGQLGTDTLVALASCGHDLVSFTSARLDITDAGAVSSVFAAEAPDLIINCAAYTKVDLAETESEKAFAVNEGGVRNLALAAKEAGAAVLHISTDFVYDGSSPHPYTEEDATSPLGVYGISKLKGEEVLREVLPEHIIIRTSWLYGAYGKNFIHTMLRLAAERESLSVVYDQVGSPTWTKDLAGAIVVITNRIEQEASPEGGSTIWGTYGYANHGVASWYDLAVAAIEEASEMKIGTNIICTSIEPIKTEEYPTPAARPAYSVLDTAKIKRVFGIKIPHWRESLKEMLKDVAKMETEVSNEV